MICTQCQNPSTNCKDSRPSTINGVKSVRRRRECDKCGHRFTTFEVQQSMVVGVVNAERETTLLINKLESIVRYLKDKQP